MQGLSRRLQVELKRYASPNTLRLWTAYYSLAQKRMESVALCILGRHALSERASRKGVVGFREFAEATQLFSIFVL